MKTKWVAAFVAVAWFVTLLTLALFPQELEVSPPLRIQAVDREDRSVSGCRIEQRWVWWGVEYRFHRDVVTTDSNGLAYFDRRVSRASRLRMFLLRHPIFAGVEGLPKYEPIVWFTTGRDAVDESPSEMLRRLGRDKTTGALKIRCELPQMLR